MTGTRARDDLGADLVKALKALRRVGEDRERRTQLYREIARATVDLREHFLSPEGAPDWAGRTWAYREYVREQYSRAGYSRDEARPVQTSVRYHVSTRVREQLSAEELEDLGLRAEDITARMRESRELKSALLASLDPPNNNDSPDVKRALAGAYLVLRRIPIAEVGALRGAAREQARTILGQIAETVTTLRRAVNAG